MRVISFCLIALGLIPALCLSAEVPLYVGTYTRGDSEGIYRSLLDLETGELKPVELVAKTENPSFLELTPDKNFLVAVNETSNFQKEKTGSVSSFSLTGSGSLKLVNTVASQGTAPCHLQITPDGKSVLIANYGGGSVAVIPIAKDGKLGSATSVIMHQGASINPKRQQAPHAHAIYYLAKKELVLAADLGTDEVLLYQYDSNQQKLLPHQPKSINITPGSGPRHLAISQSNEQIYVLNELASTIDFYHLSTEGLLTKKQTVSTLPKDFQANNSTAEIYLHPSGKWLYCSNRGHNSIAQFEVNQSTGQLTLLGHTSSGGNTPRHFQIDPTGKFLLAANQGSDNIVVLKIDQQSGKLTMTDQQVKVPMPVCILFAQ